MWDVRGHKKSKMLAREKKKKFRRRIMIIIDLVVEL